MRSLFLAGLNMIKIKNSVAIRIFASSHLACLEPLLFSAPTSHKLLCCIVCCLLSKVSWVAVVLRCQPHCLPAHCTLVGRVSKHSLFLSTSSCTIGHQPVRWVVCAIIPIQAILTICRQRQLLGMRFGRSTFARTLSYSRSFTR